jgi:hypothetical protein
MQNAECRYTSSLLKDLRNRLIKLCKQNGRDDLVEGLYILYSDLLRTNPIAASEDRDRMISILNSDDDRLKNAEEVANHLAIKPWSSKPSPNAGPQRRCTVT